jgi:hypothetical protein
MRRFVAADHRRWHRPKAGGRAGGNAREYLNLTASFDHNMMDAAPAARFTERFKELIESGYGLARDEKTTSQPIATQRVPEDMPSP